VIKSAQSALRVVMSKKLIGKDKFYKPKGPVRIIPAIRAESFADTWGAMLCTSEQADLIRNAFGDMELVGNRFEHVKVIFPDESWHVWGLTISSVLELISNGDILMYIHVDAARRSSQDPFKLAMWV